MKDESATSSEPSRRPSTSDSSATTAASGKTGRTDKKRGKMYWKFATLEGWRAEDHQTQNANQPADGAERAERMEKTTDTPGD